VEHVKAIITTQQQYSRAAGLTEVTRLEEVVESGLMLTAAAAARHGIAIARSYDETPQVEIDRHKLLQILVNLLNNAHRALVDSGSDGPKELRVSIERCGEDRVRIAVADNGVGIAEDVMPRIFRHGFSTKPDGHGFGLHGSANNALELGGTLSCRSEGPGRGAVFTLELPLAPRRRQQRAATDGPAATAATQETAPSAEEAKA
jgi:signal transduction histidine kinase